MNASFGGDAFFLFRYALIKVGTNMGGVAMKLLYVAVDETNDMYLVFLSMATTSGTKWRRHRNKIMDLITPRPGIAHRDLGKADLSKTKP